jgi:hypothetical protein
VNPGDRANDCGGILRPIQTLPDPKRGYIIVHRCEKCGAGWQRKAAGKTASAGKQKNNSLFIPLCEAMQNNPTATEKVFGRTFTSYARPIDWDSTQECHSDRYHFINCLADNNIEFRLNKFTSGKQYQNLMKMEVEMVKCIINNFCDHFMDTEWDRTRYEKRTAYRKHKADVTAKKLVKIFEKYANM